MKRRNGRLRTKTTASIDADAQKSDAGRKRVGAASEEKRAGKRSDAMASARVKSAVQTSAAEARSEARRFRSRGIEPSSRIRRDQGSARSRTSARRSEASVQRLRCLT